ncbi:MAG: peptidyl-prolyl cis-trans isomerase [Acidobacteria bacterium]|nr:peptidyl-prolyl cis-trans isomerase [Acidobacteriota bacterium]
MGIRVRVAGAALAAGWAVWAAARAEIIEEIIAKVNDQVITKSEMEEREGLLIQEMFQKFAGKDLDEKMEEGRRNLLRDLIAERLLLERGEALLDMGKVRDNLQEEFMKRQGIGDREELERLLRQEGMSLEGFLDSLVRVTVPQEILNYEVRSKVHVGEEELRAHYEEHREEFRTPETVEFRELVVLAGPEGREEARGRLVALRDRAAAGEDLEALIREHSEAPSRAEGGLVGPFERGDLVGEIASISFSLRPGELSEVVELPHGFHLIRLEGHAEARIPPFEEVRKRIEAGLRERVLGDRIQGYIRGLWEESFVYVYPRYRDRLAPEFLGLSKSDQVSGPATP